MSSTDQPISETASPGFRYDAFISYSHRDADWVWTKLVPYLRGQGLQVCVDRDCFQLGSTTVLAIEAAVENSRLVILIITPEYLESEWCQFENTLIQTLDPGARRGRTIPVLLKDSELPLRLRIMNYLDLTRAASTEAQLDRLANAVKNARNSLVPGAIGTGPPADSIRYTEKNGEEPQVLFEGVFQDRERADLAFTVYNPSLPLLVVSGVDLLSVFFKLCQRPNVMRAYSGVRRTNLAVDLVKAGTEPSHFRTVISIPFSDAVALTDIKLGTPGWSSKYERQFAKMGFRLLEPDTTFHIQERSAESFLLAVKGEIDDPEQFGFVCFFVLRVDAASPSLAGGSSLIINHLFEASRNPAQANLRINLHKVELGDLLTLLFSHGIHSHEERGRLLSAIESERFSDTFLYDLAHRIGEWDAGEIDNAVHAYLAIANRASSGWRDSEIWHAALVRVLSIAPPGGHWNQSKALLLLINNVRYPDRIRLIGARLFAGLRPAPFETVDSNSPNHNEASEGPHDPGSQQAVEHLRELCGNILRSPLPGADHFYDRISPRLGKEGAAATLGELRDAPSLQYLLEYMAGTEKDKDVLFSCITALEAVSRRRFLYFTFRGIQWHVIAVWLLIGTSIFSLKLSLAAKFGVSFLVVLATAYPLFKLADSWRRLMLSIASMRARRWFESRA